MNKFSCSVSGIQNNVCKTQMKNALDKIKGVQEVGINMITGELHVGYNEPATEAQIIDCVDNSGFKVYGIPQNYI